MKIQKCIKCGQFSKPAGLFLIIGRGPMHIHGIGCRGPKFVPKAKPVGPSKPIAGMDIRTAFVSAGFVPAPSSL